MPEITIPLVGLLLLTGCAQIPKGYSEAAVEKCVEVADENVSYQRPIERALVGALKGGVIGAAVDRLLPSMTMKIFSFTGRFAAAPVSQYFFAWGIIDGVAEGLFQVADKKTELISECLKSKSP